MVVDEARKPRPLDGSETGGCRPGHKSESTRWRTSEATVGVLRVCVGCVSGCLQRVAEGVLDTVVVRRWLLRAHSAAPPGSL